MLELLLSFLTPPAITSNRVNRVGRIALLVLFLFTVSRQDANTSCFRLLSKSSLGGSRLSRFGSFPVVTRHNISVRTDGSCSFSTRGRGNKILTRRQQLLGAASNPEVAEKGCNGLPSAAVVLPGTDISTPSDREWRNKVVAPNASARKEVKKDENSFAFSSSRQSPASSWHSIRRKEMIEKYGAEILPLERDSSSHTLALTLLLMVNVSLTVLATLVAPKVTFGQVLLLALFPGSILSLWQLQILHDDIHGSLLQKKQSTFNSWFNKKISKRRLQDQLLFWGSMPSMFGYYLYLKYGHLTHHQNLGSESHGSTLGQVFNSPQTDFEDGDVLFTAHRMKLKGAIGPTLQLPEMIAKEPITMSISRYFFSLWREGNPLWNAAIFAISFPFERMMLVVNDFVVALTGRNFFFPNKPQEFHNECATYCRWACLLRLAIFAVGGWKAWLFLVLSETLWSIPPHPACAMFVTNHGSDTEELVNGIDMEGGCIPSSSTYSGRWYSLLTLGTNYHVEHHDFPTIPFHRLGELRGIAPEYYSKGSSDNVFEIMYKAFSKPQFYACMDATKLGNTRKVKA